MIIFGYLSLTGVISGADDGDIVEHIVSAIKEKGAGHNLRCTTDNTGCRSITSGIRSMSSIGG